jgi:hypothetical protein
MSILMSMVLLLTMIVQGSRWLAARWGDQWREGELPADYGMNPERPWERRPRKKARLAH